MGISPELAAASFQTSHHVRSERKRLYRLCEQLDEKLQTNLTKLLMADLNKDNRRASGSIIEKRRLKIEI